MGLAVRKKVIKLLKEIFPMTQTQAIRVDICCKMVDMIGDADDNIKVSCRNLDSQPRR